MRRSLAGFLVLVLAGGAMAAELQVLKVPGKTLADNPLGDPATRRVAVFVPDRTPDDRPLPLVVYLPGWGGSSEDSIAHGAKDFLAQAVDALAARGLPLRIASVDARSRYGGSQYLNSSATGRYADYVTEEIIPILQGRYGADPAHPHSCIVAGHSSGGYGALLLAMNRRQHFHAVVALSPDSEFEVTHRPLVQEPEAQLATARELEEAMAPAGRFRLPEDGLVRLLAGLSANYAPDPAHPGRFEWLYDAQGHWRPEVWERWLAADPYTRIQKREETFLPAQRIYLDGPSQDDFQANKGARAMYEILRKRPAAVAFNEPPGHHSDHLPERLAQGLVWILGKTP